MQALKLCSKLKRMFDKASHLLLWQEVLRLYPPVGIGQLRCNYKGDVQLAGQLLIPKGTLLWVPHRALHTVRHNWGEDALDFKPGAVTRFCCALQLGRRGCKLSVWVPQMLACCCPQSDLQLMLGLLPAHVPQLQNSAASC